MLPAATIRPAVPNWTPLMVKISGGTLYLFLAGNVENNGNHLNVFIDGGAVGENTLNTSGGSLGAMNGSVFSPSFQATYAFDMNDYHGHFV